MNARTNLWASLAIAASLGLAGCGGSSDNDDDMMDMGDASTTATKKSESISLSDAQKAALKAVLPDTGDSVELEGGGERAGVMFACTSSDPCTVTIENSAGTIVARAHSTTSGMVSGTATGGEPEVGGAGAVALRGELLDADTAVTGFKVNVGQLTAAGFPSVSAELKEPDKFTKSDTAPVALQGWTGERWTKDGEVIVRYTDQHIKTMTDGTFASQFGDKDGGSGAELSTAHHGNGKDSPWDWKLAKSDTLPTGAAVTRLSNGGTFKGSYGGVDGEFSVRCDGSTAEATCGIRQDGDGKIHLVDNAGADVSDPAGTDTVVVTFTADDENAAVEYKVQDTDYLAFGWWRDTSTGGTAIEDFKVLHSGKDTHGGDGLSGTATYNGHAAGNYVKGKAGGEFVADAKLEATFGDDSRGNVKGTISKFRDSGGNSLGTWEVIASTANYDSSDGGIAISFSATPTGSADGKKWASGQGEGSFYGESGTALPTGVAGWFHATTENTVADWTDDDVVVAGAFAATRHNRPDQAAE